MLILMITVVLAIVQLHTMTMAMMMMIRELFPGKWHLGVGAEGESLPTKRGFQQYLGVNDSNNNTLVR